MTIRQLAQQLEVSRRSVQSWLAAGMPHAKAADGSVEINPADALAWLQEHRRKSKAADGRAPRQVDGLDMDTVELRMAIAKMRRAEAAAAAAEDSVLPKAEVMRQYAALAHAIKVALDGIPDRFALSLVGLDQGSMRQALRRIADETMDRVPRELRQALASAAPSSAEPAPSTTPEPAAAPEPQPTTPFVTADVLDAFVAALERRFGLRDATWPVEERDEANFVAPLLKAAREGDAFDFLAAFKDHARRSIAAAHRVAGLTPAADRTEDRP